MTESKKTSRTLTQGMKVQTWPELMHNDGDSATVVAEQRKRFLMELALALADVHVKLNLFRESNSKCEAQKFGSRKKVPQSTCRKCGSKVWKRRMEGGKEK